MQLTNPPPPPHLGLFSHFVIKNYALSLASILHVMNFILGGVGLRARVGVQGHVPARPGAGRKKKL